MVPGKVSVRVPTRSSEVEIWRGGIEKLELVGKAVVEFWVRAPPLLVTGTLLLVTGTVVGWIGRLVGVLVNAGVLLLVKLPVGMLVGGTVLTWVVLG